MTALFKNEYGTIDLPSSKDQGFIKGRVILDELSFDSDEEVFVDDFMFLYADDIKFPELDGIKNMDNFNGVIGFNRFGYDHKQREEGRNPGVDGKSNIIRALIDDSIISNFSM